MNPAPGTLALPQLAADGFDDADTADALHLPALRRFADPWFARLGQPQGMTDGGWERRLRRAGRGLSGPLAVAYEGACDRAATAVQRWRFRHLLTAIETASTGVDPSEWAAARGREAARGWPLYQVRRLEENALELLHRGYACYDPARWPLAVWARALLRQRLIDQFRREGRERALSDDHADDDAATWALDELAEAFRALREAVDGANFFPTTPDGPDCYAAFVFDLRIRLAERFANGPYAGADARTAAAQSLPWPPWVGPRQFLPGWPRLSDLWAEACRPERVLAGTRRTEFIGQCVHALASGANWQPSTWNQWIQRGKSEVRERVAPDAWNLTLAVFFPQHESPEGQR